MQTNQVGPVRWVENYGYMGGVNYVARGDGFYVSFNPNTAAIAITFFQGDDGGCAETAICHEGKFYVLNGDFRTDLEPLIPQGAEACIAFYRENQHARSSWATDELAGEAEGSA